MDSAELVARLRHEVDLARHSTFGWPPKPGTVAAMEVPAARPIDLPLDGTVVQIAYLLCAAFLQAAADHAEGLARVLEPPAPELIAAPAPLARAVMETAATGGWLVAPLDGYASLQGAAQQRAERVLSLLIHDSADREQVRSHRPDAVWPADQLADSVITAVAASPDYELTLNKKGDPIRVGQTIVPSPHERVRLLVPDWVAGYSLLSSPTHGAAWSSLGAIAAH